MSNFKLIINNEIENYNKNQFESKNFLYTNVFIVL